MTESAVNMLWLDEKARLRARQLTLNTIATGKARACERTFCYWPQNVRWAEAAPKDPE